MEEAIIEEIKQGKARGLKAILDEKAQELDKFYEGILGFYVDKSEGAAFGLGTSQ
jgi:hypothetical protein